MRGAKGGTNCGGDGGDCGNGPIVDPELEKDGGIAAAAYYDPATYHGHAEGGIADGEVSGVKRV